MITVKTIDNEIVLEPTIFPDGTSQIWKLPEDFLMSTFFRIDWRFENEREIFDILSLKKLLDTYSSICDLYVPYLPFARQDHKISTKNTFNLHVFSDLINTAKFNKVLSFDVHSGVAKELINNFVSINPKDFQDWAREEFRADVRFFPDKGAAGRYSLGFNETVFYGEKERNWSTGKITSYEIIDSSVEGKTSELKDKRVLIVDDLCDNGGTFILAAKALYDLGVKEVGLCVSHCILKDGPKALHDAGITKIYTTNSLLKNKDGYKL